MPSEPRESSSPTDFYDALAPFHHLLFADWAASVGRQAGALRSLIEGIWPGRVRRILDASAGIGTQSVGLAGLGYSVTASDISLGALRQARLECRRRALPVTFAAGDLRSLPARDGAYDLVLACDNALPHLLSDDEILRALRGCFTAVRPGGGMLVSARDYQAPPPTGTLEHHPYPVREVDGVRHVLFQIWRWRGELYDLTLYAVEDDGRSPCRTHAFRSTYYAIPLVRLAGLFSRAGFEDVRVVRDVFFQPIVLGTRPAPTR